MVKARDFMTTDVIWVKKEISIYEAGNLLLENEITGMPVVEEDMTLVGVVTEKDILDLFHSDDSEKNKTVEDFMTRPAVSYKENDSFETICNFMLVNYFRRIPVISKKGKLVGIISRPDVLRLILNLKSPAGASTA